MIAITNGNKVTRHYHNDDKSAIYTDIVRCLAPNTDFTNVDEETHLKAADVVSWCELSCSGETYDDLKEYGIHIVCYDKELGIDYDYDTDRYVVICEVNKTHMNYTNGLAKEEFLQYMYNEFPDVYNSAHSRDLLENIVNYGTNDNFTHTKNDLFYYLSDMIPEVTKEELLRFIDKDCITNEVTNEATDINSLHIFSEDKDEREDINNTI